MLSVRLRAPRLLRLKLFLLIPLISLHGFSQPQRINPVDTSSYKPEYSADSELLKQYMRKVDSIAGTNSLGNHFARIYRESMGNINVQLNQLDSAAQHFVKRFEISFIGYFLEAAYEFEKNGHLPADSVWSFYFSHPKAQSWQLTLIGVNAHINGDIWKGLVKNFREPEIRRYKKQLLNFQGSISKAYQPFFDDLMNQSSYLRFMNGFTKGSAKLYGEWLIYNWRLRQINLAMLYYQDPKKFKKRMKAIDRKRQKIDKVILNKGNS